MDLLNIKIKETGNSDINDILEVERLAFGYDKEADLVNDLLNDKSAEPILSLLAFYGEEAVGHILFTRALIKGHEDTTLAYILAPLAVKPEFQKMGIGGMLIKEGLLRLIKMKADIVFVLGHMDYYPKYGFIPDAESFGFPAPYPIPAEYSNAWMVQPLNSKNLNSVKGKVTCADQLNKPEHWRE